MSISVVNKNLKKENITLAMFSSVFYKLPIIIMIDAIAITAPITDILP